MCWYELVCTSLTGIVHQNNLLQQRVGGAVDDGVDGSQQRAPRLVVEYNHHAGTREIIRVELVLAPTRRIQNNHNIIPY